MPLAREYTRRPGYVLAMLGQPPGNEQVRKVAEQVSADDWVLRKYALPFSGASRAVAAFKFEAIPKQS